VNGPIRLADCDELGKAINSPEEGAAALLAAVFLRAIDDLRDKSHRRNAEQFLRTPVVWEWAEYIDLDTSALRRVANHN
jgi:hypothetical protein